MDDLISRSALLKHAIVRVTGYFECHGKRVPFSAIPESRVLGEPAVDVAPVVHGRWKWFDYTFSQRAINRGYICSVCGRVEEFGNEPYCHCGAKMDEEAHDEE